MKSTIEAKRILQEPAIKSDITTKQHIFSAPPIKNKKFDAKKHVLVALAIVIDDIDAKSRYCNENKSEAAKNKQEPCQA